MSDLTPAQVALLDQAHAAALEDLAELVKHARTLIAEHGPMIGPATLTLELSDQAPPRALAGFAALAAARIVDLKGDLADAEAAIRTLADELDVARAAVDRLTRQRDRHVRTLAEIESAGAFWRGDQPK